MADKRREMWLKTSLKCWKVFLKSDSKCIKCIISLSMCVCYANIKVLMHCVCLYGKIVCVASSLGFGQCHQSVYKILSAYDPSINKDYKMVHLTIVVNKSIKKWFQQEMKCIKRCSCWCKCFMWVYVCPTGSETLLSSPQSLHTCYQVSDTCSVTYFTLNRQTIT